MDKRSQRHFAQLHPHQIRNHPSLQATPFIFFFCVTAFLCFAAFNFDERKSNLMACLSADRTAESRKRLGRFFLAFSHKCNHTTAYDSCICFVCWLALSRMEVITRKARTPFFTNCFLHNLLPQFFTVSATPVAALHVQYLFTATCTNVK